MAPPYAHSRNRDGERQALVTHLSGVADLAAQFASDFGAAEVARFLGLWHDLGKFNPAFQSYLLTNEANPLARKGPRVDHKGAGASLAARHLGLLALAIQGHHGGLGAAAEFKGLLAERMSDPAINKALDLARQIIPSLEPKAKPDLPKRALGDERSAELLIRLLFSALVDADFLDTEMHFDVGRGIYRGSEVAIEELWRRFERDQRRFANLSKNAIFQARAEIYESCLRAASNPPGIYRLTVPTGGGKTRSSMAFALQHALHHGHRRIVIAVPFISITEQIADVYRDIFGADGAGNPIVLEHHSGAVEQHDGEDLVENTSWLRLAAENWDAPIIVTTTVQLFESLFANKPSRCRKVHSLARSIIILDEAQALPPHLLSPILDVLRELCAHYRTTVVLSTATQPAFEAIPVFASVSANEIVPHTSHFFRVLDRVEYQWMINAELNWQEVVELMRGQSQVLVVVNTKNDALNLLDALDDPETFHLSTLLCGMHRRKVIGEVKQRLANGESCRLISTQVIEAGVDLDFPLVLRALGPLDGIIQAAGRCNREGRLAKGRVIVFRPSEGGMPPGAYRTATGITGAIYGSGLLDANDPDASREYFRRFFDTVETDREGIQQLRKSFDFPEVAKRFRMIDDATETIAVASYGTTEEQRFVRHLLDKLRSGTADGRRFLRLLQPYLISLRASEARKYRSQGLIETVTDGLGEWLGKYDLVRGLTGDDLDPDSLVI